MMARSSLAPAKLVLFIRAARKIAPERSSLDRSRLDNRFAVKSAGAACVAFAIAASTSARVISADTMSGDDRSTSRIMSCAAAVAADRPRTRATVLNVRIMVGLLTYNHEMLNKPVAWIGAALAARGRSLLIQHANADRTVYGPQVGQQSLALAADHVGFEHDVADLRIGLQILRQDVDAVTGDRIVDVTENARDVAVNVDEAGSRRPGRQLHLREIDRAEGGADIGIVDQLARDLAADAVLGLLGRAAEMRREDHIGQALQRGDETLRIRGRLDGK